MTALYWWCLGGGFAVTVLLFLAGDVLGSALDALDPGGAFDPLTLVGGVTVFGGAGLLLEVGTGLTVIPTAVVAAVIAVVLSVVLHVVYVRPMRQSENSTGFSQAEYAGKTGEVGVPIPASGFGEVVVRMGASTTFQTAASFTGEALPAGTPVVVVEVGADGTLHVAPLTADEAGTPAAPVASRLQTRA